VKNLKLREPPSVLNPQQRAKASINVDLPEPFSPIMKVTCFLKINFLKFFIAGIEDGYLSVICNPSIF